MEIDRAGTFRGFIVEHGVSQTTNKFPQFTARLRATEWYDEETGEYIPWEEYDQTIDAYLVLYTKDEQGQWKELMNAGQLKKVLGWDGLTFEGLAAGQYSDKLVMFRVEEHEWKGKTKLQVQWLDEADASPTRQLPKYDTSKLKALTASMGGALTAATPAPTAAPVSAKPAVPPKAKRSRRKPLPKSNAAAEPAVPSTGTPPPASPAPAPAVPSGPPSEPVTKNSAWAKVNELNSVGDEKLAAIWLDEAKKIGKAENIFTTDDWHTLQEAVLAQVSKF